MRVGKRFQRRKEGFSCERCSVFTEGDGYTNHCPKCLWSKHVDEFPGDRLAGCGGLMRPVALERAGDAYRLTHRCERCGYEKNNKARSEDDFDALLRLSARIAETEN